MKIQKSIRRSPDKFQNLKVRTKRKVRHLAAVAIIFDENGNVLLTKRYEPRSLHAHGMWQFPGGGIEFGEHPKESVLREIKEETGIEIKLLTQNPFIHSQVFKRYNLHVILFGFPARYKSGALDISRDKATGDAKWFKLDEINFFTCLPHVEKMIERSKKFL